MTHDHIVESIIALLQSKKKLSISEIKWELTKERRDMRDNERIVDNAINNAISFMLEFGLVKYDKDRNTLTLSDPLKRI
jgi:hypothetical protein